MAKAKKQTEIAGTERPSIDTLDEICAERREALGTLHDAQEHANGTKATLLVRMQSVRDELERDENGVPCYVYEDGEDRYTVRLKESVTMTKEKKPTSKPDLRVVEDGDID